jgi:phytanoyl-CoA hydroxylase
MHNGQDANISLSSSTLNDFEQQGFVVLKSFISTEDAANCRSEIEGALCPLLGPAELEVDVNYPGAPASKTAPGGDTPRRLLYAYSRFSGLRTFIHSKKVQGALQALLKSDQVNLSQNHHNCVMTKHPGFGSLTAWHQDIRYWNFSRPDLISMWVALGSEYEQNGGLMFIPGSHQMTLDKSLYDEHLFLRTESEESKALLKTVVKPELEAGDVVFFHCRTFHAAGQNLSEQVKLSPVFTFYDAENRPLENTKSSHLPGIPLTE